MFPWSACSRVGSGPRPKILNNILENIGQTPLVRINRIAKEEGLKCELCRSYVVKDSAQEFSISYKV